MHRFSFYHWLALSLVLHAAIAVPLVVTGLHGPSRTSHNKLAIELFGMVSNRQMEEKKKGSDAPRPRRQIQRIARQAAQKPIPAPRHPETVAPEAPVSVGKADETPEQAPGPASISIASGPAASAGGDVEQRRQSLGNVDQGAGLIREYLARVAQRVQANLVYPEETRKRGVEGVSTVSFTITESGDIKGGSLRVRKSCGQAALDSNALKSTLASAPFEKPPKEIEVTIAVSFTVNMARTRTDRASTR